MASFLENIEPFRGTGERNKDGQTLEEFLEGISRIDMRRHRVRRMR